MLSSLLFSGVLTLGAVASYGEDARTATIAVSPKGRVSLAVATKDGLELIDWTKAAGPQRRWTLAESVVARGEDRPQVGFDEDGLWIVALRRDHEISAIRPETHEVIRIPMTREPECVAAASYLLAAWTDGGALRWSGGTVDDQVCPCCRPGIVRLPGKSLLVAYRDEGAGNVRDIFLRKVEPGKEPGAPVRVSTENWKSPTCPMEGPAVLISHNVVVVAYVVPGESPELKVGVSADGGASFPLPAQKVAIGHKPQLARLMDGRTLLAFDGRPDGVFVALSELGEFGAPVRVDENKPGVESSGIAIAAAADGDSAWVSWIDKQKDGERRVSVRRVVLKQE